jgi:hypothetical protein
MPGADQPIMALLYDVLPVGVEKYEYDSDNDHPDRETASSNASTAG